MQVTVGAAPDSWGIWFPKDDRQMPWSRFLDEIKEAGYDWMELGPCGYLPTDVALLGKELERRRLKVSGSFVMADLSEPSKSWTEILRQLHAVGPVLKELGAGFLVLIDETYVDIFTGAAHGPPRLDEKGFARLVDTSQRVAEIARRDYGLRLVFHPHAQSHIEHEDQIETLLAKTDPDLISVALDIGHHAYCGGDPVGFMRKHHARIPYLHFKNVDRDIRAKVQKEGLPFAQAVAMGAFVEPAKGVVDFVALRDLLREIGYVGYGIVEQDMFPTDFAKPLPIAKRTRAYLREIGIG